jgi:hypothetical protein
MVEAAILGKPVLSILADEFAATQEGTLHFHYLLPENGGFLRVAQSIPEHVAQISEALRQPELTRDQTARFVRSFLRPRGLDREAPRSWQTLCSKRRHRGIRSKRKRPQFG